MARLVIEGGALGDVPSVGEFVRVAMSVRRGDRAVLDDIAAAVAIGGLGDDDLPVLRDPDATLAALTVGD